MKEHLFAAAELGASDRAALQSLIPLASGLGAGTIFGLFFVGRRPLGPRPAGQRRRAENRTI